MAFHPETGERFPFSDKSKLYLPEDVGEGRSIPEVSPIPEPIQSVEFIPEPPVDVATAMHRELWKNPAQLIARRKAELQARGEPIVEKLAEAPFSLYLTKPLPELTIEQKRILGYEDMKGDIRIVHEEEVDFTIIAFGDKTTGQEHVAVLKGIGDGIDVPIRIHSSCITAETFHAANCDCREQLENALLTADNRGKGGVLFLNQEGRGFGLEAKVKQLKKMYEEGLHTVAAYKALGYPTTEARDFTAGADMLKILGVQSIEMMTGSPDKIAQMKKAGIPVTGLISSYVPPRNARINNDLVAKRDHHGHRIPRGLSIVRDESSA